MKCNNCGEEVILGRFCTNCGKKINVSDNLFQNEFEKISTFYALMKEGNIDESEYESRKYDLLRNILAILSDNILSLSSSTEDIDMSNATNEEEIRKSIDIKNAKELLSGSSANGEQIINKITFLVRKNNYMDVKDYFYNVIEKLSDKIDVQCLVKVIFKDLKIGGNKDIKKYFLYINDELNKEIYEKYVNSDKKDINAMNVLNDYKDTQIIKDKYENDLKEKKSKATKQRNKNIKLISAVLVGLFCIIFTVRFVNNKIKETNAKIERELYEKISNVNLMDTSKSIYDQETVVFGRYPQSDESGKKSEDLEWIVIDRKDGKAFLITKYFIDCYKPTTEEECKKYSTSGLRKYLDNMYNKMFSNKEKVFIEKFPEGYTSDDLSKSDEKIVLSDFIDNENSVEFNRLNQLCTGTKYAFSKGLMNINQELIKWVSEYNDINDEKSKNLFAWERNMLMDDGKVALDYETYINQNYPVSIKIENVVCDRYFIDYDDDFFGCYNADEYPTVFGIRPMICVKYQ